jgi:hypothetical protein
MPSAISHRSDHAFGQIKASIEAIVKGKEVLLIEKRAEGSGGVMVTIKVN